MARDRAGFTLIEILVAMLILAVGLLGVEALAIGAARAVAGASSRSRIANAATRVMETKQQEVRNSLLAGAIPLPTLTLLAQQSCGTDSIARLYVCTDVQTRLTASVIPSQSARVTVQVAKNNQEAFFTLVSYVFHPALP